MMIEVKENDKYMWYSIFPTYHSQHFIIVENNTSNVIPNIVLNVENDVKNLPKLRNICAYC